MTTTTEAIPRMSVITPSLNHSRFLRETIDSVRAQTLESVEHIVIDGGSTDGSIEILQSYPGLIWISEPDESIVDAYRKGLARVRGEYVAQCCVSDGFLDRRWFELAVAFLDAHPDVALVWALPQYMTEDGALGAVSYAEFLEFPPPADAPGFYAFWQATRFAFPEGNYIVRADVIRVHFPDRDSPQHYRIHPHLGFVYEFMRHGLVAAFLPRVANYGRIHADQRGKRLWAIERPAYLQYVSDVLALRRGGVQRFFAPDGRPLGHVTWPVSIWCWPVFAWQYLLRSRLLSAAPQSVLARLAGRCRRILGKG